MNEITNVVNASEEYEHHKKAKSNLTQANTPNTPNIPNTPNLNAFEKKKQELLNNKRPHIAQIKTGIHKNTLYYGVMLFDDDKNAFESVITSDKVLYSDLTPFLTPKGSTVKSMGNEIKQTYGLFYRFSFEYDVLDSQLSTEFVKKWVEGKAKETTLKELFNKLVETNKKYMYYPDEQAHEYVALDMISTYFLPCFEAKGRTVLVAEKGSGKTRQCQLYKLLCFNSIMSADITKSNFFRLMESTCGTFIIDDFDSLNEEQKTDILQHYKTGYKATSKSIRQNTETKTRKAEGFRNYGHVIINNTQGLDDISADRSVFLPLVKTSGELTTRIIDEKEASWADLREQLFFIGLNLWREVKDTYSLLTSENLSGREWEVSRAVLTLAEMIDHNHFLRLESWLKERFSEQSFIDLDQEWDYIAFCRFFDFNEAEDIGLKQLAEHVAFKSDIDAGDKDYKSRLHGINIFLGRLFKKTPIFKVKYPRNKAFVSCPSHEKLKQYFEVKKWPLPE